MLYAANANSICTCSQAECSPCYVFAAPQDCTTNPSLCYQAVQDPEYQGFLQQALKAKAAKSSDPARPYAGAAYEKKPLICTTKAAVPAVQSLATVSWSGVCIVWALFEGKSLNHNCVYGAAGVADVLSVIIGSEMLKIVPGRVSTEVSCSAH
jgi:transaldolase